MMAKHWNGVWEVNRMKTFPDVAAQKPRLFTFRTKVLSELSVHVEIVAVTVVVNEKAMYGWLKSAST